MATKLSKGMLRSNGLARLYDKLKLYIFTTTVPMTTKPGRMMTYIERLPPIKLLDPSVR